MCGRLNIFQDCCNRTFVVKENCGSRTTLYFSSCRIDCPDVKLSFIINETYCLIIN
jgi:hypothetical protein